MAPRGRPRKRGNPHLDAALKAMAALTFPEKLVRDTVDELLEVYGGDDGWGFIKDASYSVLIDTLLEKQQDGTEKRIASPQDHARSEHGTETSAVLPSSSRVSSPTCIPMEVVQPQTNQPLNSAPLTQMPDSKDCLPSKRHRPYHGWIGNDDEDLFLVELTPAPLLQGLKLLYCVMGNESAGQGGNM
ncbi:hypothetical protein ABKV19_017430 [Rosa sericea]